MYEAAACNTSEGLQMVGFASREQLISRCLPGTIAMLRMMPTVLEKRLIMGMPLGLVSCAG